MSGDFDGRAIGECVNELIYRVQNLESLVAILAETKYTVIPRRSHQQSAQIEHLLKKIRRLP